MYVIQNKYIARRLYYDWYVNVERGIYVKNIEEATKYRCKRKALDHITRTKTESDWVVVNTKHITCH